MDRNADGTDVVSLFAGDAMIVLPARSTATSVIPSHPSTLRPVTIKQLYGGFLEDIQRYPVLIEGDPVSSFFFRSHYATCIIMRLETPADSKLAWSTSNGDYVQVFGKPGMNENFIQIKAFKIRQIVNYNDTTHHYLYAIYTTLDLSQKKKNVSSASTIFPKGPCITPSDLPTELSTKDKIFAILRDPAYKDIAHGVSLKLLCSALDISQDEIMQVITEQIYLGMIYTTVDDNHFKSSI
ncbi:hypothetical protein ZWY2020_032357 [Hordeum vulgare]|nr:hypothetical protein ZWY2020_032357 [Hordeum vulgare]